MPLFPICAFSEKIIYTGYAVDLIFLEDFDQNELLKHVTEIIEKQHFRINVNKTKLMTPNTR